MPDFEVTGMGQFEVFAKNFTANILARVTKNIQEEFLQKVVEEFTSEFKKAFDNPDSFGLEPLSQQWLNYKESHGLDERAWRATSYLVENIIIKQTDAGVVFIGWDDSKHPVNDEPLAEIAAALEFGVADKDIPERPIIRPIIAIVKQRLRPILLSIIKKHVLAFMGF